MTNPFPAPPISFTDPLTRKVWLSERPKCGNCGFEERRGWLPSGNFMQMECPREVTRLSGRHHRCNTYWWCYALYPGTIGGTFAAMFGYHAGQVFLHRLFPETHALSEDDLWGFQIVPFDGERKLLQVEVSRAEAQQKPNSTVTQKILALLRPITKNAAAL